MKPSLQDYTDCRDAAWALLRRGDVEQACVGFEAARDIALLLADEEPELVDGAEVNLALARVNAHEDELAEPGLREVLMRSNNPDVCRVAAQSLAKILSHRNEHEKARWFAREALRHAENLEDADQPEGALKRQSCHTLLGLLAMNQSYLDEALEEYRKALALIEAHPLQDAERQDHFWALSTDSIGYALVMKGDLDEGLTHLRAALERAKTLDQGDLVAEIETDICFALLRMDRLDEAERHGLAARAIAEEEGFDFLRRNSYYLLGEIYSRRGDDRAADGYFRLLAEFFPELGTEAIGDFFRVFDVSSMINLKEFA
ncbi:MAG: hypothetical protein AAF533_18590 [Acidobacteriota bacterium]